MLSAAELERYARHIVMQDIGGAGQQKLKNARVLVIGAGGLGAPVLQYLSAAGVGTLGIVDDDTVSLSNLQRQVIHDTDRLGEPKVASAAEAIARLNPNVKVEPYPTRIAGHNALALISGHDLVVDGSDNFDTRYLVSDACFFARKPLVTAAVGQFDGSITTLRPFDTNTDGDPNPTYRCLFPQKPREGLLPTCAQAGVLGALTGIIGAMQAMEVIKELTGIGEGLVGRMIMFDARSFRMETIRYKRSAKNPLNGNDPKSWAELLEEA
ncbi:MAG: molybdopterin-synthase adenylyltransferase MoeB [Roseibium album]|uniref:Molybdopterin-synthase adenylyltransferase n=1 Tax=Roseibium album TaxID=311410 RepID=A0A0M6Z8V2_9HYPH|nr:molybdopterin-synthase adenylyltransferase MoeB [Roseibium album]MBG6157795.1 adenylyltransferase/sulfurtransferase [Labrenzia sp. EL_162]MBG6195812.1 adenylyltransferase/sulfurtransferase [Labrenzia sp. EL_159]MBG6201238.1 adenylyltransferase/sulfurtransferase [Labrenzia sp. EL_13]MCR9057812.1 molybdopterin-synthase adenylyltransferase MoeB [Paracoccaceae bacterium]CTQ58721.1 putative adenylyltransferase/sulfurtransferase MoeZ [Roseibium album]